MQDNLIITLKKIPLFNGLDEDELKVILSICKTIQADADTLLFKEGDPSHDLYILLSGEIELSNNKAGKIYTLSSCDIFGEIGLITQRPRSASAHSLNKCSLLSIHHIEFNLLTGKYPRIASVLMKNISTNLANHVLRMNNTTLDHIPHETKTLSNKSNEIAEPTTSTPQVLNKLPK